MGARSRNPDPASRFGMRYRPASDSGFWGAVVVPLEARTHCIAIFIDDLVPLADKWLKSVMIGQTFSIASLYAVSFIV